MGKFLLVSILVATFVLPMRASGEPSPKRALRRAVVWMIGFNLLYLIGIVYILPRLG